MLCSKREFWARVYEALDSILAREAELLAVDFTFNYGLWPIRAPLSMLVREFDGYTRWVYYHFNTYKRWISIDHPAGGYWS